MQKTSQYAINGNAGAWTTVRCTIMTTRMSIQEDDSVNAGVQQGLQYQQAINNGGNITWGPPVAVPPALSLEPIIIAGNPNDHAPNTEPIGNGGSAPYPVCPGGPVTNGTIVFRVKSASATPTTIDVTEWN